MNSLDALRQAQEGWERRRGVAVPSELEFDAVRHGLLESAVATLVLTRSLAALNSAELEALADELAGRLA